MKRNILKRLAWAFIPQQTSFVGVSSVLKRQFISLFAKPCSPELCMFVEVVTICLEFGGKENLEFTESNTNKELRKSIKDKFYFFFF